MGFYQQILRRDIAKLNYIIVILWETNFDHEFNFKFDGVKRKIRTQAKHFI